MDDSPRAVCVVTMAAEVARSSAATVRVYHAVAVPPDFPPAAATRTADLLPAYLHERAVERLQELAAHLEGVPFDTVVEEAQHTARAIVAAAVFYDADLIVIGSHRHVFMDRLLGTTSGHVVNTSPRDVLVVRRDPCEGSPA